MTRNSTRVLDNAPVQDEWRLLRGAATGDKGLAPGHWVHLSGQHAEASVAVYRYHAHEGWWAALLPPEHRFAQLTPGEPLKIEGVRGEPLPPPDGDTLMLGSGQGVGPILALAEGAETAPRLVCLGDASGLPVRTCPSRYVVPQLPANVIAGVVPLEAAGIAARVALPGERPGCYDGAVMDLLAAYLEGVQACSEPPPTALIAAGPWPDLAAMPRRCDWAPQRVAALEIPAASGAPPR